MCFVIFINYKVSQKFEWNEGLQISIRDYMKAEQLNKETKKRQKSPAKSYQLNFYYYNPICKYLNSINKQLSSF